MFHTKKSFDVNSKNNADIKRSQTPLVFTVFFTKDKYKTIQQYICIADLQKKQTKIQVIENENI